jgi:4-hydroxybenzoate polyprenyltransferase
LKSTPLHRLLRWPGIVTAAADATTAGLLMAPCFHTGTALTAMAAALAYGGGVALNDAADAERDRTLHPERPVPSGAVSRGAAWRFALLLLAASPVVAFFAHPAAGAGFLGVALCAAAYDLLLKRWAVPGAAAIALCRGGSVFAAALAHEGFRGMLQEAPARALILPLPWCIHGFLITLVSRLEERPDALRRLPLAAAAVATGPVLALVMLAEWGVSWRVVPVVLLTVWCVVVGNVSARIRLAGRPEAMGLLVREGVFGFILLDAVALGARLDWPFPMAATALWLGLKLLLRKRRS